ncbi:MAG: hypothetical protein COA84_06445 [Robiginitomaculum sp.]|nr:MAG: hypothetical protein COA84_06445 [Robiginitomaculum sp.]
MEIAVTGNYSKTDFLTFLDYLGNKGLLKKNTVASRKAAVNALLSALDSSEVDDVRNLDLDHIAIRLANLEGDKFTLSSLQTYKSRYRSALDDFINYSKDPTTFVPKISQRQRKSKPQALSNTVRSPQIKATSPPPAPDHNEIIFPIPIREDLTVRISGLPSDLTEQEAQKISKVIQALAQI